MATIQSFHYSNNSQDRILVKQVDQQTPVVDGEETKVGEEEAFKGEEEDFGAAGEGEATYQYHQAGFPPGETTPYQ